MSHYLNLINETVLPPKLKKEFFKNDEKEYLSLSEMFDLVNSDEAIDTELKKEAYFDFIQGLKDLGLIYQNGNFYYKIKEEG